MRRLLGVVFAGLGLALATACATDAPAPGEPTGVAASTAGTAQPSRPPVGGPCELISLDAVTTFLGQPARVEESLPSECIWRADTRGTHQLHLQVYSQHSYFAPDTWGGTPEMIDGIGEEAFLVRKAMVGTTAAYWDGQHAVFLNYTVLLGSDSSADKADDLVDLLRTVADRA